MNVSSEASNTPGPAYNGDERAILELAHLTKEIEKLTIEVETLRSSSFWDRAIGRYLPIITAVLAVAGFWFGVIQYYSHQHETDVQRTQAERNRSDEMFREAAKPFWDSQIHLYLRASEAAAAIANSDQADIKKRAESEFWLLYWGPLATVEDVGLETKNKPEVEAAMVQFGAYLRSHRDNQRSQEEMQVLSLELAHAIRNSIPQAFRLQLTPLTDKRQANAH